MGNEPKPSEWAKAEASAMVSFAQNVCPIMSEELVAEVFATYLDAARELGRHEERVAKENADGK